MNTERLRPIGEDAVFVQTFLKSKKQSTYHNSQEKRPIRKYESEGARGRARRRQPLLLRGTILKRTYGTHETLYISLFLLPIFGPIYNGPP